MTPQRIREAIDIVRCTEIASNTATRRSKLSDELIDLANRFQWHPVSEIHEDYGDVVLVNLRVDEFSGFHIGSNLNIDWDDNLAEFGWTHFSRIVPLGQEELERLREGMAKIAVRKS